MQSILNEEDDNNTIDDEVTESDITFDPNHDFVDGNASEFKRKHRIKPEANICIKIITVMINTFPFWQ